MNSRERVLTALNCEKPDKVPYVFSSIEATLQEKITGKKLEKYLHDSRVSPSMIREPGEEAEFKIDYVVHPETARKLKLDAIGFKILPPLFAKTRFDTIGGHSVEKGLLNSREMLKKVKMPDPDDEKPYREMEEFVKIHQGEFAIFGCIRLGVSTTLLSMGYDNFCYKLYEDTSLVENILDIYVNWNARVIGNLIETGVDFLWSFDDMAFKSGPFFSPETWNELFVPRLRKAADKITIPWIYHSDGNLLPILDDMLPLGMSGLHPLEPGTMDLAFLKEKYGKKLCLVGNMDIDRYLTRGTPEEIDQEVKRLMDLLGKDGGYIISDSNSVPHFCIPEKVIAMSKSVEKYRDIYRDDAV